jgi:hypothetical protein
VCAIGLLFIQTGEAQEAKPDANGWYSLFDGKSLDGWKAAEFQDKGFPNKGFEFQINNTGSDKAFRTGSIYPAKPLDLVVAKDDEWFAGFA